MSYETEHGEFMFTLRTGIVRRTRAIKGAKCGRCDGKGTETCGECFGSGSVRKPCEHCSNGGRRETCPKCKGKPDPCRGCHGKGRVDLAPELKLHPADVWTIRELRALSINGSFR